MGKKQARFNKEAIDGLAKDKPVVYKIKNDAGTNIYTGVALRGRVAARLKEHLAGGKDFIPGGMTVEITQHDSIAAARKSEARIIKQAKPRHNKQGK